MIRRPPSATRTDTLFPYTTLCRSLQAEPGVHLHPADRGQVVALGIEEQAVEQRLGGLQGRRLARAHHPVDVDQRLLTRGVLVERQRVAHVGDRKSTRLNSSH